jgi:TPR repeat protein
MRRRAAALFVIVLLALAGSAEADLGRGVAAYQRGDYRAALAEWRPLADAGHADAQFYLGFLYENGRGVAADDRAAVDWYRRAAEQDHREAAKRLALINFAGRHMWTSKLQAVKWFRRAAELGEAESQGFTGVIFREGWGVAPDPVEALKWFILAAEQGHAKAANDRDALARTLPTSEVAEAKRRATEWRADPNR